MVDTTFEIEVQDDHVEKVSQTRKPILALSELIWNALDGLNVIVHVMFLNTSKAFITQKQLPSI